MDLTSYGECMTTDLTTDQAISQLVTDAVAHQSDVEQFLALHTEDAVLVNLAGRRVIGKPALREAMSAALRTSLAKVITDLEIVDITHLDRGAALVGCLKTITDQNDAEPEAKGLPEAGSLTYLVVERDGVWRIALAQTTPILNAA